MRYSSKLQVSAIAAVMGLALAISVASAQSLVNGTSCLRGSIEAYDYSEFDQNFRESTWDSRAGVELVADHAEVTLKVLNMDGTSVCENVADLDTRCTFRLRYNDNFSIRIDNTMRSSATGFRICAF